MSEEKTENGVAGTVAGVGEDGSLLVQVGAETVAKPKRVRRTKAQIAEAEARGEVVRRGARSNVAITATHGSEVSNVSIAAERGIGDLASVRRGGSGALSISFRWFDMWIGLYVDAKNRTAYVCPLPMICIRIRY
jgi:hypothetical protein